jgi:pyridoxamine 5'-phosphate oxidase
MVALLALSALLSVNVLFAQVASNEGKFQDIFNQHNEFYGLPISDSADSPFLLFDKWFEEAIDKPELDPNAFVLSTVGPDLIPSSRVVYLKGIKDEKFIFFTNYLSQKGRELAQNPNVSMLFFWPQLKRQVRLSGIATKIPQEDSDAYFSSRPRDNQIRAWASNQSQPINSRQELIDEVELIKSTYTETVPRPPYWGGYEVEVFQIEFWQGMPSRLHDRLVYTLVDGKWQKIRKNP